MAQGTMPELVFSGVLISLALLGAAKAYASGGLLRVWPFAFAVSLTSPACRMTPPAAAVPVQGTHDDVTVLSGNWSGRYWSKTIGRHGIIRFSLPEHADTGYGEVEITFSPSLRLQRESKDEGEAEDELEPKPCTVLDITLVRVEG